MKSYFQFGNENLNFAAQFLVLAIVFFLGIESWIEDKIEQSRQNFFASAITTTEHISVNTEPEVYIRARLLPLLKLPLKRTSPSLEKICRFYQKKWGLNICLYRFNQKGDLIESGPANIPHLWLMKNLYKCLTLPSGAALDQLRRQIDKKIPFSFGDGKDVESIKDNRG
ncbi:hypothetical protein HYY75_10035, partial [bacterium]|nr:hypothetical protein [bacterium]